MNWRPKGWKNLWDKQPSDCLATPSPVWEAGADAMLEALKAKGAYMTPEQMRLLAPDAKYGYGWLVFIPEGDTPLAGPDKAQ